MEKGTTGGVGAADGVVLKIVKNLPGGFTKQTADEPRNWRDVPLEERRLWVRLAHTARKVVVTGTV